MKEGGNLEEKLKTKLFNKLSFNTSSYSFNCTMFKPLKKNSPQ